DVERLQNGRGGVVDLNLERAVERDAGNVAELEVGYQRGGDAGAGNENAAAPLRDFDVVRVAVAERDFKIIDRGLDNGRAGLRRALLEAEIALDGDQARQVGVQVLHEQVQVRRRDRAGRHSQFLGHVVNGQRVRIGLEVGAGVVVADGDLVRADVLEAGAVQHQAAARFDGFRAVRPHEQGKLALADAHS